MGEDNVFEKLKKSKKWNLEGRLLDTDGEVDELLSILEPQKGNIKELSLKQTHLSVESVQKIAQALVTCSSLKSVYFSENVIGFEGTEAIAFLLEKHASMTYLSLCATGLNDDLAKVLCRGLAKNSKLKELNLNKNSIGDVGAKELAEALTRNSTLEVLHLSDNFITEVGSVFFKGLRVKVIWESNPISSPIKKLTNLKGQRGSKTLEERRYSQQSDGSQTSDSSRETPWSPPSSNIGERKVSFPVALNSQEELSHLREREKALTAEVETLKEEIKATQNERDALRSQWEDTCVAARFTESSEILKKIGERWGKTPPVSVKICYVPSETNDNSDDQVQRIITCLKLAKIETLDGQNVEDPVLQIKKSNFVVIFGSKLMMEKYRMESPSPIKAELKCLELLVKDSYYHKRMLPILLDGTKYECLPTFLHQTFSRSVLDQYVLGIVFELVKDMYDIPPHDEDWNKLVRSGLLQRPDVFQVFISHSRATGHLLADVIKLRLAMRDPTLSIFLDVDNLSNVHDLEDIINKCDDFILLLTEGVFEREWVQKEICWALQYEKNIIPVFMDDFPVNKASYPKEFEKVLAIQAIKYIPDFRMEAIERIYERMKNKKSSK